MDALSSVRKNALVICGKCLSFRFDVQNKKESRASYGVNFFTEIPIKLYYYFNYREHRLGIDLVHDDVEKELLKECEVIKGVENLLVRTLEQTQEQIRRLKATLYYMDHELENKENNLHIDKYNLTLKETSLNLSTYHGTSRLDPSLVSFLLFHFSSNVFF